ncbi:MAG: HAD family hydrolase [Alloprevotella sp.]|nr:HAD family hydrolase [Alloprevotella sp.]
MIKGILFDYGGTLDTNARHWAYVLQEAYEAAQIPISEAQFREAYVFAERALAKAPIIKPQDNFRVLLRKKIKQELAWLAFKDYYRADTDKQEALIDQLADYCNNYALHHINRVTPTLERLATQKKLVVVSNFYGNLPTVLADYKIDRFFGQIIESAVVGVRKPNPEIFSLGVQACGVRPEEVVVVGDSYKKDILPASSLGCHTVWIHGQEWKTEEYDESVPDKTILDFGDLEAALDDIEKSL